MNKGIQQWYWKHCKKCDRWLIGNSINFQKDNSKKDDVVEESEKESEKETKDSEE